MYYSRSVLFWVDFLYLNEHHISFKSSLKLNFVVVP